MASGTQRQHQQDQHQHEEHLLQQQQQQQQHQQQQHQQQQQQQHQQQQQQQNNQMQFASNQETSNFNLQQQQQHTQQISAMSPISAPMSIDNTQGHLISMNPHHHQLQQQQHQHQQQQQHQHQHHQHHHHQQQSHMMDTAISSTVMAPNPCNQSTSHIQQHQPQPASQQQQQKSQLLPLLLSPRPPSLKTSPTDQNEHPGSDHDQLIIEQVISLENEFSDSSGNLASADSNLDMMMNHQQQQQQHGDINLTGVPCATDSNQLSTSSEDLLNLLLELDREPSHLIGLDGGHQLDPDEKAGIENIRQQLMSCEVQSDQAHNQNLNCISPIINQLPCQQLPQTTNQNIVHQQQQPMLIQSAPVMSHHQQQQPHHMSSPGLSQQQQQQQQTIHHQQQQQQQSQHRLSVDQSLLHGSYTNVPVSAVPISSSGQSFAPQTHQNVARISQSNPMSIVDSSPSPSWQQPQLSPYSPQSQQHHNSSTRTTPSRQSQHSNQQPTTSPQLHQLHHPLQRASPSQSVSPPATSEPSPIVKKNPMLNAQLINSRPPSLTPTRFLNNQTSVLNQNPILNAKLSQSPFTSTAGSQVGNLANQSLNPQTRYISQQTTNFNYDLNQQQQSQNQQHQQNAQHTPPQQTSHLSMYRPGDQQSHQVSNQNFKPTTASTSGISTGGGSPMTIGSTSPNGGGLSQQVKQEIRRKVQQPKQQQQQQHQTTSLLKQLLSDKDK